MRRVEEEMRKRERVEEEKLKAAEEAKEKELLDELQIEKDEKYEYSIYVYSIVNAYYY